MPCVTLEVNSPVKVGAAIHRWTIASDDIYLLKFQEAQPDWLDSIVKNIIEDTGVIGDLTNLENRFDNFEQGYTEHLYDWRDGDNRTLLYVQNQYVTNGEYASGIQEIKTNWVSKNEAGALWDTSMGAWMTGVGGAWFNEKIEVVSTVAYAAAKSASTLTATIKAQDTQMQAIIGSISVLERQVDGKVETTMGTVQPTLGSPGDPYGGDTNPNVEPYKTWAEEGTLIEHTGDTYLYVDTQGNLLSTYRFIIEEDSAGVKTYKWVILNDDLASKAYQKAIDSGVLADSKIVTYYQATPPVDSTTTPVGLGDLWLDSDDNNKMYRYDGTTPFNINRWIPVRDTDITASVRRLDEATVDIAGVATARSSLVTSAGGFISGFVSSASTDPNNPGSEFKIFADRFKVASSDKSFSKVPFSITNFPDGSSDIKFNGRVEFSNITGGDQIVTSDNIQQAVTNNVTVIDGSTITTGEINAALVRVFNLNANNITTGTIYNRGGNASNYTMAINLDRGFIHIK